MQKTTVNLIPETSNTNNGNYFCTWCSQSAALSAAPDADTGGHAMRMRDMLTYDFLFGETGLLSKYMEKVRGDLIAVLDDGWDVPPGTGSGHANRMGSLQLNPEKFGPLYVPGNNAATLKNLSDKVKSLGYRGTGVWVATQIPHADGTEYSNPTPEEYRAYWEERAREAQTAGIVYWKVDWGYGCNNSENRRIMTEAVRKYAPELWIEHALVQGPYTKPEDLPEQTAIIERIMPISDVLRTYDIVDEFTTVTTLFRCDQAIRAAQKYPVEFNSRQILNVEEEPYVAAAFGCANGVMRHKLESPENRVKREKMNQHFRKSRRLDETVRSLLFQRIAPPFGIQGSTFNASDEILHDASEFHQESWPFLNGLHSESAPAVMSRNCPLPEVQPDTSGDKPFVIAMRHPNGTYALAALPRFRHDVWRIPQAQITMQIENPENMIGLFGEFASVTLQYTQDIAACRILMQDPLEDTARDVTDEVKLEGGRLTIPGALLHKIGLAGASADDISRPGVVLKLTK